jgi:Uma2 family endonuclease
VVKKEAAEELKDDDLLEDADDYEDGKEEEEEDGDVELVDNTPEDGQHRAEDRFFLGTLAKLFRGQASQSSREKLDIVTVVLARKKNKERRPRCTCYRWNFQLPYREKAEKEGVFW